MRISIDLMTFEVIGNQVNVIHKEHGLHGIILIKPYTYFRDVKYKDNEKEQKEIEMIKQYLIPGYNANIGLDANIGGYIIKNGEDGQPLKDEHGNVIKHYFSSKTTM